MKNDKVALYVKEDIMKELFQEIDNQRCIIDVVVKDSKEIELRKDVLNKESIVFLNKCKEKLKAEYDKGQILFFRKYGYEKILNDYVAKTYNVEKPEIEMFPSEKRQKELELERQAEKLRHEEELQRKANREFVNKIIAEADNLKWERIVGATSSIYKSEKGDRQIEYAVTVNMKKKTKKVTYSLLIDQKKINSEDYDGDILLEKIRFTKPKTQQKAGLFVAVNKNREAQKDEKKAKRKKTREKRAMLVAEYQEKLKLQKVEEERKKKAEEKRLAEIRKQQKAEKKKREEEKKKKEEELQKTLQRLPLINVKDFMVRRTVFKCMHSNHHVKNIDAAVKILNHKDEEHLVKISAGYCEECNIYFIMESTYQNLKSKGIILCRITDEKNYMKNSYVNGMLLAQESILMQYGYSVSQSEGLSATRRQKILAVIMDNNILSRSEIISYLDFFINQRQYQSKFELAVSKWEADREFVELYRWGEYARYGVNWIYRT